MITFIFRIKSGVEQQKQTITKVQSNQLSRYFYILQTPYFMSNRINPLTLLLLCSILLILASAQHHQLLKSEVEGLSDKIGSLIHDDSMSDLPTNGTEGYYLSPHALGKQTEVQKTLSAILSKLTIQKIQYNRSESIYTMSEFILDLDYNDGKQKIEIGDHEEVTVTNGTVFFGYKFNYTVTNSNRSVTGWAHGSVFSDALTYKKHLIINNDGHLEWALPRTNAYNQLKITSRMGLKRMDPFNQGDHDILLEMLDRAFQSISPANFQTQLLEAFNRQFFPALNNSLNHEVFGNQIDYTFHHPTKGPLNMTMVHHLYGFSVDKVDGYKIIFVTEIDGHEKDTTCNITVPDHHSSFEIYGGIQNIHLNCLYQDVVNFIQSQGWLDTQLNSNWEVPAFQFYAGDLFDVMNNLYTKVLPQSLLEGQCKANRNNLVLKSSREWQSNTYRLSIEYNCSVKTTTKTAEKLDILQFIAQTRIYIKAFADKKTLNFEVLDADVMSMSFTPVNNFIVTNMNLALFKATQVLKKNIGSPVFGNGFPSLSRQSPVTRVDNDSVIYYDSSAVGQDSERKNVQLQIV